MAADFNCGRYEEKGEQLNQRFFSFLDLLFYAKYKFCAQASL
jgi:hypothetical protein